MVLSSHFMIKMAVACYNEAIVSQAFVTFFSRVFQLVNAVGSNLYVSCPCCFADSHWNVLCKIKGCMC